MLLPRNLKIMLLAAAQDSLVVLVNGARQTGKSTLMQGLFDPGVEIAYVNLDDLTTLAAARKSPKSFLQNLRGRVIIDEVQRVPELLLPIKEIVDRDQVPGRFFLTGSAHVLSLPKLSDSLAGRMEIHTLWPVSQGEIRGIQEAFVDALFGEEALPRIEGIQFPELLSKITTGGYPHILRRETDQRRSLWFQSYLTTILERDVRELSNIEGLTALPDLLALIASRAGGLLNLADLSRSLGLPYTSLKRYMTLLEAVFLVVILPSWSSNVGQRVVKAPKVFLNDTGLLCHLLGCDASSLQRKGLLLGSTFENFVVIELFKQVTWSATRPRMFYFRTVAGQEVDVVLESRDGRLVGIECKASSTVNADDFMGLQALQERAGKKFYRGVILYTGSETASFGEKFQAVPVSALWEVFNRPAPALTEPTFK